MIRNDEELRVFREQLGRAEAALDSLRRDVFPKNESLYRVMAESYVDTILQLRSEVDSYLEIDVMAETADLVISLEGPHVGLGKTSAVAVTRLIDAFRRGLQAAVEILETPSHPRLSGRPERWIENICNLSIAGLAPGSVKVLLAEPQDQSLSSKENRESLKKALDLVFGGLHWADMEVSESVDQPFSGLSIESRQAILNALRQLLPPEQGDVESVSFSRRGIAGSKHRLESATLTRESRGRIRGALKQLVSQADHISTTGVIRKLDLDDRSFTLRERPRGELDLLCRYRPELEAAVKKLLDHRVTVIGTVQVKGKQRLLVDSVELVDAVEHVKKHRSEPIIEETMNDESADWA